MSMQSKIIMPLLVLVILVLRMPSNAQPPQVYYGGPADGYASLSWYSGNSIFTSGPADGADMSALFQESPVFAGGQSDGYSASAFLNPSTMFASAGSDGFSTSSYFNSNQVMQGGMSDGFAAEDFLYYHDWTGLIGTGWLVAGNWENNVIPDDSIRARIPAGVPNYPGVNAGTFSIGSPNGDYLCRDLLIEPGAQMLTRINTITQIYGKLEVRGLMNVKNQSPGSLQVIGGTVVVYPGGELHVTNE